MGTAGKLMISPSLYLRVRWDLISFILLWVGGSKGCEAGVHTGATTGIGSLDSGGVGAGDVDADVGELEHSLSLKLRVR